MFLPCIGAAVWSLFRVLKWPSLRLQIRRKHRCRFYIPRLLLAEVAPRNPEKCSITIITSFISFALPAGNTFSATAPSHGARRMRRATNVLPLFPPPLPSVPSLPTMPTFSGNYAVGKECSASLQLQNRPTPP